jgi:hypothetical protein
MDFRKGKLKAAVIFPSRGKLNILFQERTDFTCEFEMLAMRGLC